MARNGATTAWLDELFKRNDRTMETVALSIRHMREGHQESTAPATQAATERKRG